ncbi:MAG: PepSY-like domain-containing protein [Lewinella sp.]|nr:PepSY-like domain-containing protein [Lewinella sp.]
MMQRIKFILPLLALSLAFLACEKEQVADENTQVAEIFLAEDLTEVPPADLPASAEEYIEANYFDTYIEAAYRAPRHGYMTMLGNGENVFFDLNGGVIEYEGEVVTNGPFGGNHPNGPCVRRVRRWLRGHFGNHDCDGDGVPDGPFAYNVDELPTTITDYVATNYPDAEILRAAFRDDTFLILINGRLVLAFDADGNFLREVDPLAHCMRICNNLTAEELPEAVATYIGTNFPEAEFGRACGRENGRTLVVLLLEEGRVILGFNADGELVFQRP